MFEIKIPDSIDKAINNVTGKATETAGDLLDAALTYAGRNIISRYKINKADEKFQITAYKQAQEQALKLQEIKNLKIQEFYGDYIEKNITSVIAETLKLSQSIPENRRILPDIGLIGYAFENCKYIDNKDIRSIYARLLVNSIDGDKADHKFKSLFNIINQLSPDEIKIFDYLPKNKLLEPIVNINYKKVSRPGTFLFYRNFSLLGYKVNCEFPKNTPVYFNNLCRLGLIETLDIELIEDFRYDEILKSDEIKEIYMQIKDDLDNKEISITRRTVGITDFGEFFRVSCTV